MVEANLKHSVYGKYGRKRTEVNLEKMIDKTLDVLWSTNSVGLNVKTNKFYLKMSFPAIK